MGVSGQHPGYFPPIPPVFLGRGSHVLGVGVDSTEVGRWNEGVPIPICKHKTILPLNLKPNWIFGKGSLHQWPKEWPHPGQEGCPGGGNLGSELLRAQSLPRASLKGPWDPGRTEEVRFLPGYLETCRRHTDSRAVGKEDKPGDHTHNSEALPGNWAPHPGTPLLEVLEKPTSTALAPGNRVLSDWALGVWCCQENSSCTFKHK